MKLFLIIFFSALSILCYSVVIIMYTKLSFIDTPYLIAGIILDIIAALIFKSKYW